MAVKFEDIFEYNPDTGELKWKVSFSNRIKAGDKAGSVKKDSGYIRLKLNGRSYQAHRIAWQICHGEIPAGMEIDHINSVRNDNRISNLRLVTHLENVKNQKKHCTNVSGVMGVSWNKKRQKWYAYIHADGKRKYLGYYDCMESAVARRRQAERHLGYHELHGNK
ncbi:TPA: HNH endonuclease [Salmonella enterica subsp. enterica serovar Senftenberg]|nr:HNH endonuclease [Salmonella enterica subsp. enterica serovar Senftenberg]